MNGNGRPSPPSVISRPDYLNLIARYYIRAIRQVTQVKHDALAAAELTGHGESRMDGNMTAELTRLHGNTGFPLDRVPLSAEQQQQIRISCAAFWTVLEYAPQYNVSEVEIGLIIRQIDERMNEERAQGGDGQGVARSLGVDVGRPTMQQVVASGVQGSPAGGSARRESFGMVLHAAHDQRRISGEQDAPIHRPIPRPYNGAAFNPGNIASTSQVSPATTSVSLSSPTVTNTSPCIGVQHPIPTPPATVSPNAGITQPQAVQNGGFSPNEFSALAGAVVPTPQQVEDNRRRRSSDAQSRRSSGTYTRRESGLAGALVPVRQGVATQDNRMRWSPVQPAIVPYASSPTIQTSGYSIPGVSPLLSSGVSFASPTPPMGSAISPTMSAPGRFASPASSTTSPAVWTAPHASTSTSAPEAGPRAGSNPVPQEPSRQRIGNPRPVAHHNAPPASTSSSNTSATPASDPSRGAARMIRVSSGGQVSGRAPGSTAKSSRNSSITFNAAAFARVSAFEMAKRLYEEQQREAARDEEAIEAATTETETIPTSATSPNVDKEPLSGKEHEVALEKNGPVEVDDVEEPMGRADVCPDKDPPAASGENTRDLSATMTTSNRRPLLTPIMTGSSDVSQSPIREEPTGGRTDPNNASRGTVPSAVQPQAAIEVLTPRSAADSAHTATPGTMVPGSASAIPLPIFEFKPPAKPIPSLPDWLSGNSKKQKQKDSEPSLPNWASGSDRRTARPEASPDRPSKRRRLETGPLWSNEKAEQTKRPSEIIDLTEDLPSLSPIPVATRAQDVSEIIQAEPVSSSGMAITVIQTVLSGHGSSLAESAKPDGSEAPVAPTVTRPSIENLLDQSTGTPAATRERPVVNGAEDAANEILRALEAGASTPNIRGEDVLDLDVEMQDVTAKSLEDNRSKAPTLSFLLNKGAQAVNGTESLSHQRMNGFSETNALTSKGAATTVSSTDNVSGNPENLTRRRRSASAMPPALHSIPAEPTFDDLVQWQRKVWRACFCDWSRCGAVLDNWDTLEKVLLSPSQLSMLLLTSCLSSQHVGLVHIQRQRPRSKPKANLSPAMTETPFNARLMDPRQRLIRAETGESNGGCSSSENDDSDPIALLSAKSRARMDAIRLSGGPSAVSAPFGASSDMTGLQVSCAL